jgi:hypothetical protein
MKITFVHFELGTGNLELLKVIFDTLALCGVAQQEGAEEQIDWECKTIKPLLEKVQNQAREVPVQPCLEIVDPEHEYLSAPAVTMLLNDRVEPSWRNPQSWTCRFVRRHEILEGPEHSFLRLHRKY